MHRPLLLLVCLCHGSTAFVFVPAMRTMSHRRRVPRVATAAPHVPPASVPASQAPTPAHACRKSTTVSTRRRPSALLCSGGDMGKGGVEVAVGSSAGGGDGATPEDDPFRPERASVSPMVINALVPVLFKEDKEAVEAAAAVLEQRRNSGDWQLTEEEERAVTTRVYGVATSLNELRFMLATAVGRTPSIAKYGMLADYGMCDDVEDNPLAQMNQAECLLALYMLHKEKVGVTAVDFLDADRLEVLKG